MRTNIAPNSIQSGDGSNVVCILGAHRSGTSMFAHVLHDCGLYLGEEKDLLPAKDWDNPEGYWENENFVDINNEILETLGGSWSSPPVLEPGWSSSKKLSKARKNASALIAKFQGKERWGWKDPRTMLTLEFWQGLLPKLQCVLVVRNPVEAALSLAKRPFHEAYLSYSDSLSLWLRSHEVTSQTLNLDDCLVTHLDAMLDQPNKEIARVLTGLDWPVPDSTVEQACQRAVKPGLHHHSFPTELTGQLSASPKILEFYSRICSKCGPTYISISRLANQVRGDLIADLSGKVVAAALRDGENLKNVLAETRAHESKLLWTIEQTQIHVGNLDALIAKLRSDIDQSVVHINSLEADRKARVDYIEYLEREELPIREKLEAQSRLAHERLMEIQQMTASLSWRITKPIRSLRGGAGGAKGGPTPAPESGR